MKKYQQILSASISLLLVACHGPDAIQTLSPNLQEEAPVLRPNLSFEHQAKTPQFQANGHIQQEANKESLTLNLNAKTFGIQGALPQQVAFVQIEVVGQGISGRKLQDGPRLMAVEAGDITATVSELPVVHGALRVVTLRGYDAEERLIPNFEASGYYRSQAGVSRVNLTLGTEQALMGAVLRELLKEDEALAEDLNLSDLQALLHQLTGYEGGNFSVPPGFFDPLEIAEALSEAGDLPTVEELQSTRRTTQQVQFPVTLSSINQRLDEAVLIVIEDPASSIQLLPQGAFSGTEIVFFFVAEGEWAVRGYDGAGNLLGSTSLTVTSSGFALDTTSLALADASESSHGGDFLISHPHESKGVDTPVVAHDANGDFVVVWKEYNDSDPDNIYARRYAQNGQALGNAFRVNPSTSRQSAPDVAMDDLGNFVVTYECYEDGDFRGICASRYDSSGASLGSSFVVNTTTTGFQDVPKVAMDNAGNFVVAWEDDDSIDMQRYDSSGAPQGSEVSVTNISRKFDIAMDSDGDFVVAWRGGGSYGTHEILAQRYNSSGGTEGSIFQVQDTVYRIEDIEVGMDDSGQFVVAWDEETNSDDPRVVFARRFDNSGSAQGSDFVVASSSNTQDQPSVSMNGAGQFVVSYRLGVGPISAQRYDSSGTPQGALIEVPAYYTGDNPSVSVDDTGSFVVVWEQVHWLALNEGIFGKRYNSSGVSQDIPE